MRISDWSSDVCSSDLYPDCGHDTLLPSQPDAPAFVPAPHRWTSDWKDPSSAALIRWWYEQERMLIRPRVTVAMGATAARSVLGKAVTQNQYRVNTIWPKAPRPTKAEARRGGKEWAHTGRFRWSPV